jgi:hypothetical protein
MFSALRTRTATRALTRSTKTVKPIRRFVSTSPSPSSSHVTYTVAAGLAAISGAVGYTLASYRSPSGPASAIANYAVEAPSYGTPEDYKKAIQELREAFDGDEDRVSTDEGDLETHGFSVQDPHPGQRLRFRPTIAEIDETQRFLALSRGVAFEHGGCSEGCKNRGQVESPCHSLLWRHESRRADSWSMCCFFSHCGVVLT